jgi:hypothetical protein
MAYLNQVLDARSSPDASDTNGRAVDGHIGPNLHIVFNLHGPDLRDFVVDA